MRPSLRLHARWIAMGDFVLCWTVNLVDRQLCSALAAAYALMPGVFERLRADSTAHSGSNPLTGNGS